MTSLTVIIPTKNRVNFLKNLLCYYSEEKAQFKILILDSSTNEELKKNKINIKNIKNLKITHISIIGKAHEVVKKCRKFIITKYCCLTGDDDYLYAKNIKYFIQFLEKNKSYAGAGGISYLVRPYKNTFSLKKYNSTNLTHTNAFLRCSQHLKNYTTPQFSICKTKYFSEIIQTLDKKRYPHDIIYDEMVLNVSLVCYGKFKNLQKTHLFRLIGHETNNISKNSTEELLHISKKNMILYLEKLILKIDNKNHINLREEFSKLFKKWQISKKNIQGINFTIKKYNFKESRIFYYLCKYLFISTLKPIDQNIQFLTKEQILNNISISKDIKIFIRNIKV